MTAQRSFKRLVRTRMDKTGESYTAARLVLLRGGALNEPKPREAPARDVATCRSASAPAEAGRSGSTCSTSGARPTRPTARSRVGSPTSSASSPWSGTPRRSRAATSAPGSAARSASTPTGSALSASKTVAVPVESLYDAFVQPRRRKRWLPDATIRQRTATRPQRARFDWDGDGSRRARHLRRQGDAKSTVTISHERLADAAERDRMKIFWRERTASLKEQLER